MPRGGSERRAGGLACCASAATVIREMLTIRARILLLRGPLWHIRGERFGVGIDPDRRRELERMLAAAGEGQLDEVRRPPLFRRGHVRDPHSSALVLQVRAAV